MYRFDEVYLDDVTECQGELFVVAQQNHLDMYAFIKYYMTSRVRELIDIGSAYHCTLLGKEIYELLLEDSSFRVPKSKTEYGEYMLEWIGQFYSLCQWYSDLPSKIIIEKIPVDFVFKRYNTLHDMDISLAVERVLISSGLQFRG